jgi:hypothetical protein
MTADLSEADREKLLGVLGNSCHGIVTRDGIEEPCEKPTTCVIDDPEGGPWAACVWHAHRYGTGRMITLAQIRDAAAQAARAEERRKLDGDHKGNLRWMDGHEYGLNDGRAECDALRARIEALADEWEHDQFPSLAAELRAALDPL